MLTESVLAGSNYPDEVRIAFDGDAVLFSDEAERVFQAQGLDAFQPHELSKAALPLPDGPFKPLLAALHRLQQAGNAAMRIRTALVTARSAPAHERAIRTLMNWDIRGGRGDVPGRPAQGRVPARVRARLLLRRPDRPCRSRRAPRAFRARGQRHRQPARAICAAGSAPPSARRYDGPALRPGVCAHDEASRRRLRDTPAIARPRQDLGARRALLPSDEKWKARGLLAAIVLLNLGAVYMLVLINDWYRAFYDALEKRDQAVFWRAAAAASPGSGVRLHRHRDLKFYLTQLLEMRWRAWMTRHYLQRWLADHAFYRLELARYCRPDGATPDNPDQRIQEDMHLFTDYTITLSMGLLNAVVTLASFVGILWGLRAVRFHAGGTQYEIPGFMVWIALVYCVAGTVITHFIGRPLIGLNFRQQRYEADFRHHLVRVREYSEAIALDRGEQVERQHLDLRFGAVLAQLPAAHQAQKNLVGFTTSFGQAAVIFPFIVRRRASSPARSSWAS